MNKHERHSHWEHIYRQKGSQDVSWYQSTPETSLAFIQQFALPKSAKIIDVGGGDSMLVDHLIRLGFKDLTVLDISRTALERAKIRLGKHADKVNWIEADITEFEPAEQYDFWHDRAVFHFLTAENDIEKYIMRMSAAVKPSGLVVMGTFSEKGPNKCSGIEIKQYSEKTMTERFKSFFEKIRCISVDHITPFKTIQNFVFCSFRRHSGFMSYNLDRQ